MQLLEDEPRVWSFPSCEPGRFKECRLGVVRWWKRTGSPTKPLRPPPGLKLAILTRGRVRLPFKSIKWLLKLGLESNNPHMFWANRLPRIEKLVTILASVDVTVELFMVPDKLTPSKINFILGRYLKQRHATELPNCATRFLFAWNSVGAKANLENLLSEGCPKRISLDPLIDEAGIRPRPGGLIPKELKELVLLCYASFPNDIDLHLAPPPSTGGTAEERMWGHIHRAYNEIAPVDEEDDEVICLMDKLLKGANDEFTGRGVAQNYADALDDHFISHMRTSLMKGIKWKGTNVEKFIDLLREFNGKAQAGLSKIDQLFGSEIYHRHPRVKEMWKWRNKVLRDPNSIMNCYKNKA
jgi:hypothetical protein